MSELKPCPFCAGEAVMEEIDYRHYPWIARCTDQVCCGNADMRFMKEDEAGYAWNQRLGQHQEQAEILRHGILKGLKMAREAVVLKLDASSFLARRVALAHVITTIEALIEKEEIYAAD